MDVILQLIDKAGDFVSDDIWFRVVQFVTNNEDLQVSIALHFICYQLLVGYHFWWKWGYFRWCFIFQSYAAVKAREYLDKPAIHETMVKVCFLTANFFHKERQKKRGSGKKGFCSLNICYIDSMFGKECIVGELTSQFFSVLNWWSILVINSSTHSFGLQLLIFL